MLGILIPVIVFVAEFGLRITLIIVLLLRRRLDPNVRLAWIVFIFLVPFLGSVAYFLIGDIRLGSQRIKRHAEIHTRDWPTTAESLRATACTFQRDDPYAQIASLAQAVGGTPPRRGNIVKIIGHTDETIAAMIDDIDRAEHHVHLLTYIFLNDSAGRRIAEAMVRAAERSVQCRVLLDGVGSRDLLLSSLPEQLRNAGVEVVEALPVNALRALFARMDLRNHRKILVVDNHVGYAGSQNIADAAFAPKRTFAPWVDCMVRIEGPAVTDLQRLFAEDWYLDTGDWLDHTFEPVATVHEEGVPIQIIGTGPNADTHAMRQVNHAAVHLAREEIILTSPYFVPDAATVIAIRIAANRGVDTRLVVPARNDSPLVHAASRSYYDIMLESGVKIYEYTKGLLHAKTMTIDRYLGIVSSANMDRRSFELNFEVTAMLYDSDLASRLRFLQISYLDDSIEVDHSAWNKRGIHRRAWQNAVGMISPLL